MAVTLPTFNSSTAGSLSALGVGSGLDLNGLVSKLMTVEQQPLTLLNQQEAGLQAELSSLGSVKGSLSSLQSAAQTLASASAAAYGATVSDSSLLTASADSTAAAGSYAVGVSKLAQAQKLIAGGVASTSAGIGTGSTTLTFTLGTISSVLGPTAGKYSDASFLADATKTAVNVTIDSTNNTLAGIRDAINAANAGVTASIVNDGTDKPYRLSLTSNNTGAASSLQLSVSGDTTIAGLLAYDPSSLPPGQNLSETQTAQDAKLTVDGVNITSATNTVAGAMQGVTLNLAKAPTTSPVTVTVQRNNSNLVSALSALVNAYNDTNKTIATATAKGAPMQGDWRVVNLQYQVRSILGSMQSSGGYTNLTQLGISFQKDGSLALDSNQLNAALSANVGAVSSLAAAIGNAINSAANNILGTSGPIASETDGINRTITDIGNRRTSLQARIDATQQRYQAQFAALDALISSMNQTSTYLAQQLAILPSLTINNNKG